MLGKIGGGGGFMPESHNLQLVESLSKGLALMYQGCISTGVH